MLLVAAGFAAGLAAASFWSPFTETVRIFRGSSPAKVPLTALAGVLAAAAMAPPPAALAMVPLPLLLIPIPPPLPDAVGMLPVLETGRLSGTAAAGGGLAPWFSGGKITRGPDLLSLTSTGCSSRETSLSVALLPVMRS